MRAIGIVAALMPDLLGGRLTMVFASPVSALPLAREGKVRPLAVTSLTRAPSSPDLPTMVEAGFPGRKVGSARPAPAKREP